MEPYEIYDIAKSHHMDKRKSSQNQKGLKLTESVQYNPRIFSGL